MQNFIVEKNKKNNGKKHRMTSLILDRLEILNILHIFSKFLKMKPLY